MRREIAAVVFFLKRLVKRQEKLEAKKVEMFVERLAVALQKKFKGHWYPENPSKGQAYRCIRVNSFSRQDPDLLRACRESGLRYADLGLPPELTLWIDPGEVCCRYGEQNPCFSVATLSSDEDHKDVAKNVTNALERVTSDYHSGSSSDEESTRSSPLIIPNRPPAPQKMNPFAPVWHPKKVVPVKGQIFQRPNYNYRPCGRAQCNFRNSLWVPPVYRGGAGYWAPQQYMTYCYNFR